jgi:hypothetical protein
VKTSLPVNVIDELKGEAPKIIALLASPGFEIWDKYAAAMEQAYKDNIALAESYDEFLEAKANWNAVRKARQLPLTLLAEIKAQDSESTPTDAP